MEVITEGEGDRRHLSVPLGNLEANFCAEIVFAQGDACMDEAAPASPSSDPSERVAAAVELSVGKS